MFENSILQDLFSNKELLLFGFLLSIILWNFYKDSLIKKPKLILRFNEYPL